MVDFEDTKVKIRILKYLLSKSHSEHKYVLLNRDDDGLFLTYVFDDVLVPHSRELPGWVSELEVYKIYELGPYSGTHWFIANTTPVSISDLFESHTANITLSDIQELYTMLDSGNE